MASILKIDLKNQALISGGCVGRLTTAYAWAKPVDFIGTPGALPLVAAHGRSLCPMPEAP
jgi:hypothetical protein